MTDAEMNLDSFTLDGIWVGQLNAPWLGGLTHTIVDGEDSGIVEAQRDCMRAACTQNSKTLDALKNRLLNEYQNEIYGSVTAFNSDGSEIDFHELTPKFENQEQLWATLSETSINIPPEHRIADNCCFAVSFECNWDEEHGISILFDKSGNPTDAGGHGDHF